MPSARPFQARKKAPALNVEGLMAYAARVLTSRAQTISELRDKLRRRAANGQDVDEVIRRLQENGYLNDHRFAESFANWRRESDGLGKTRVVRDLLGRGVAVDLAKKAVESAYSATDESAMIQQFLERKFRGKDLRLFLRDEKHLASAYRRLRAAGFSSGNSIKILKRYASQAEALEDMQEEPLEESN